MENLGSSVRTLKSSTQMGQSVSSMEASPLLSTSARDTAKKSSSPLLLRLSVGEIKFNGSPNKAGDGKTTTGGGLYGMSGALQPVPSEHARNNEQLLAQRRQRMEGANIVKQARHATLEDEEEAYALFKRQLSSNSSMHLPTLLVESTTGVRSQTSPYTRRSVGGGQRGSSPQASPSEKYNRQSNTAGHQQQQRNPTTTPIVTVTSWKDQRPQHSMKRLLVQRATSRTSPSPSQSTSTSPPPIRTLSKISFDVPSSPSTPPPSDAPQSPSSPSKVSVPKIHFNFRVRSSPAESPTPMASHITTESPYQSSRVSGASPPLSGKGEYDDPNFYYGYRGYKHYSVVGSDVAPSARTTDSLPYWALPPLPIGTSETPRVTCGTPSVESVSVLDTARNDERTTAWRAARNQPAFRQRTVINTSAARSTVDAAAADVDWNEKFQALLELPCATPLDAKARADAITQLQDEFRHAVLPIVETIVLERDCTHRTIQVEALGGQAGGDKYRCGQIIVKFASSRKMVELYGSHDNAMKSVVNELKGLKGLASSDVPLLHFPLGMLVSFLGHYVWASAQIPIAPETLLSGSRDGGRTVVEAKDAGARAILEAIGTSLNLKWHRVGRDLVSICGPIDLEVHCGLDGRYYALDAARMYPPDANAQVMNGTATYNFHLYRSLRHELLREWPEPLSSDAFSPFGRDNKVVHDDEVLSASLTITKQRVPTLIAELDRTYRTLALRDTLDVSTMLHTRGINMRYLALVIDGYLKHCSTTNSRPLQPVVTHLMAELVARCFASATRGDLLSIHSTDDASMTPYHTLMVDRLNSLLGGTGPQVEAMWHRLGVVAAEKFAAPTQLRRALEKLACRKTMTLANISADWFHSILWRRASQLLGVEWDKSLSTDDVWLSRLGAIAAEGAKDLFRVPLIAAVVPVVKTYHINPELLVHSLISQGRLGDAEARYEAELNVRRSVLGETPAITPLLHSMSELYAMPSWGSGRPRLKDALRCSELAVRIFQRLLDERTQAEHQPSTPPAKRTDEEPASTRADDDTSEQLQAVLPIHRPLPRLFWEGYVAALAHHGRLLREAGRVREALDVVGTAIQYYSLNEVENRRLIASLHSSQALNWRRLGHLVEAYESAQASVAIAEAMHLSLGSQFAADRYAESLCLQAEAAHSLGYRKEAHVCSNKAMMLLKLSFNVIESYARAQMHLSNSTIPEATTHQNSFIPSLTAAVVFSTWVEVRLDMAVFESDDKTVDLEVLCYILRHVQEVFANGFGLHNQEILRAMMLEARILRLQGHYHQGTRLLEDAIAHADYLHGPKSYYEALLYTTMVEFSFLPMVEQPIDRVDDRDAGSHSSLEETSRYRIAESHLQQAKTILTAKGEETSLLYAYISVIRADIVRCRPDIVDHNDLTVALSCANDAVDTLEGLQLHNAMPYIYAMNVAAMLRIRLQRNARVLPDLLRVLASSDRFMLVADSDSYTQESVLHCQKIGRRDAPAASCKISLSHDGYVRKLAGKLQLVSLLMSHNEILNAAMVVKEVNKLVRQLFPPHAHWSEERNMFLPLMEVLSEEILRRTGGVPGPVTDIALQLNRIASEERTHYDSFQESERQRSRNEKEQAAVEAFRTRQERVSSQAKQVGTYFGTRTFDNGFALLHSLLDSVQILYPDGATRVIPHSITIHNDIVKHILFARRCMEELSGRRHEATEEALLQAEDHVVEVLRCPVHIEDPSTFDGWEEDNRDNSGGQGDHSQYTSFRFGEGGSELGSHFSIART